MASDLTASVAQQTSVDLEVQAASLEHEAASLLAELQQAEITRRSVLITGTNQELALHDKGMGRLRVEIERATARSQALRAELPSVREREELDRQARVHAKIVKLTDQFRELVEAHYPGSAAPLIALLERLASLSSEVDELNRSVPAALRIEPEDFRNNIQSDYAFPSLQEAVRLPAITRRDEPLWPLTKETVQRREPVKRPAPKLPEFSPEPIVQDARRSDPGIIVTRVPLDVWMREREARLAAERQANGGSR